MFFKNRQQAGSVLANAVFQEWKHKNSVVIAIPNGGVPVARAIAKKLRAPLDIISVAKVGTPLNSEYEIGAIGDNYQIWLNNDLISFLKITQAQLDQVIARSMREVQHIKKAYRRNTIRENVQGRSVILVDDGLASGATMLIAIRTLKIQGAKDITVMVPVASQAGLSLVRSEADFVFSAHLPTIYGSVGEWYEDYSPIDDHQAVKIVNSVNHRLSKKLIYRQISAKINGIELVGEFVQPLDCKGWIIFAHGNTSSRKNSKNIKIAQKLNRDGFGTLMFDLLTDEEANLQLEFFDIDFLAQRLSLITRWLTQRQEWNNLPIGYFGAGKGSAVALQCCAAYESSVFSIVCRNGRPDLVKGLDQIKCPVLLIVEAGDDQLMNLNQKYQKYFEKAKTKIIPRSIEKLATTSEQWFEIEESKHIHY